MLSFITFKGLLEGCGTEQQLILSEHTRRLFILRKPRVASPLRIPARRYFRAQAKPFIAMFDSTDLRRLLDDTAALLSHLPAAPPAEADEIRMRLASNAHALRVLEARMPHSPLKQEAVRILKKIASNAEAATAIPAQTKPSTPATATAVATENDSAAPVHIEAVEAPRKRDAQSSQPSQQSLKYAAALRSPNKDVEADIIIERELFSGAVSLKEKAVQFGEALQTDKKVLESLREQLTESSARTRMSIQMFIEGMGGMAPSQALALAFAIFIVVYFVIRFV